MTPISNLCKLRQSFNETNHTDVHLYFLLAKPRNLATIGLCMRIHEQPMVSKNLPPQWNPCSQIFFGHKCRLVSLVFHWSIGPRNPTFIQCLTRHLGFCFCATCLDMPKISADVIPTSSCPHQCHAIGRHQLLWSPIYDMTWTTQSQPEPCCLWTIDFELQLTLTFCVVDHWPKVKIFERT